MALDRTVWKTALTHYRAWNEAEFKARLQQAGQKSQTQKWREYLSLMEFGRQIRPWPTENEQRRKIESLERYYHCIQQFEAKRQSNLQSPPSQRPSNSLAPVQYEGND